jgi:hypothetical protein
MFSSNFNVLILKIKIKYLKKIHLKEFLNEK